MTEESRTLFSFTPCLLKTDMQFLSGTVGDLRTAFSSVRILSIDEMVGDDDNNYDDVGGRSGDGGSGSVSIITNLRAQPMLR